ncbi:MAG: cysteine--tRNA ligase [Patescibacteria group bacterium]
MPIKLFNTISREIEEFKPQKNNEVSFYTCGPTVYGFAHIGNLRTYIFEDILKRVLEFNDYKVNHVMNITDVGHLTGDGDEGEDKIEKSALLESKSVYEIAEFYTDAFQKDLQNLHIITPNVWCKATEHIQEQIELIKKLEEKGFLYKISDGLYFDTAKFPKYGDLAHLNLSGQEAGVRVEINPEKKNPTDFAVWKFSPREKQRLMEWDSPWGIGFPGWHIECSAMSMKYLGETIDIHAGGIDHIPVHHTNEIAQSECVTGKQFVNYWLHGEFLLINDNRMGKSVGNFITLNDLVEKGFDPMVYRMFCLSSHYRSKLNFTFENLENARNIWQKLKTKFLNLGKLTGKIKEEFLLQFTACVNDDLGVPKALAVVWEVLKSDLSDFDKRATLLEFDKVLGFDLQNTKDDENNFEIPQEIKKLAEQRFQTKLKKDFKKADELRKKIVEQGFEIEDFVESYKIKKIEK